jgi:hypothetical protein
MTAETPGPALFPRVVIDRDEKGFPCLAHDCPFCGATALIVNEWNAVECLTCSWREFGPDSPRAADAFQVCPECGDTGMVWTDGCNCGVGPHGYYGMHERHCGAEPCPNGCPVMSDAELLARVVTAKTEA